MREGRGTGPKLGGSEAFISCPKLHPTPLKQWGGTERGLFGRVPRETNALDMPFRKDPKATHSLGDANGRPSDEDWRPIAVSQMDPRKGSIRK